jgi:hypothetical protein
MIHDHRWRIRLVKGISKDRGQAGQRCFCTVCSDDKKEVKRKLTAAQEALKPQDEIERLELQVKSITPSFMTYDSRVVKYYLQNIPWVGNMLECYVTHRCALEMDVLMLLCDPTSGVQVHTLERMLSTMRNIRASLLELLFYSYQRTWRHSRKQHIFSNPQDTSDVCIFHGKVSTISDTYLHSVLHDHFSSIEEYTLLWSEQHLNLKTCASDHHMKYSGRVLQPGSSRQRDAPVFIYVRILR